MKGLAVTATALVLALPAATALAQSAKHGKKTPVAAAKNPRIRTARDRLEPDVLLSIVQHAGRAAREHPTDPELRDPARGDLRRGQRDRPLTRAVPHRPSARRATPPRPRPPTPPRTPRSSASTRRCRATLDADYAAELAKVQDGPAKDRASAWVDRSPRDLLAIRANDGSNVDSAAVRPRHQPRRLPADAAELPDARLHHLGPGDPVRARPRRPVPPGAAAAAHERRLRRRDQRGAEPRLGDEHDPHRRADADREVLGAADPELLEPDRRDRRHCSPQRPRHDGAAVRRAQPQLRRLGDRLLRRQVHLPALAAGHSDPPRRHRRQPRTKALSNRRSSATRTGCRSPATRRRPVLSRRAQHDQRRRR